LRAVDLARFRLVVVAFARRFRGEAVPRIGGYSPALFAIVNRAINPAIT